MNTKAAIDAIHDEQTKLQRLLIDAGYRSVTMDGATIYHNDLHAVRLPFTVWLDYDAPDSGNTPTMCPQSAQQTNSTS